MRLPVRTARRRAARLQRHRPPGRHRHAAARHRRRRQLHRHRLRVPRGATASRGWRRRSPTATANASRWPPRCRSGSSRGRPTSTACSTSSSNGWAPTTSTSTCCTASTRSTGRRCWSAASSRPPPAPSTTVASATSASASTASYELFEEVLDGHRPLGVLPDPAQLHGRGVPGRPPGSRARGRPRPRRDRHGAAARRRCWLATCRPAYRTLWDAAPLRREPVEWALQWVWDLPEVSLVLSGMSTMQHVEEDLAFAGRSRPGAAAADERGARRPRARRVPASSARSRARRAATACRARRASPSPTSSSSTTTRTCSATHRGSGSSTRGWTRTSAPTRCTACGECEDRCPQGIAVAGWMEKAQAFLGAAS